MYSNELIKGTLKTIILKLLADNGRMYGYEITQKVKILSEDQINLTEGALYPALHKLQAEGMIIAEIETINGRKRKYYSVTHQGLASAKSRSNEFAEFAQTMFNILNPKFST